MTIRKILAYTLALIAIIFEAFFGIILFMRFVIEVFIIASICYLLVYIFRRKNIPSWQNSIRQYILTILATIGFFTSILLTFITYHNQVPGVISDITLSNSGQTVVFLQMSHIATSDFFLQKQQTIRALSGSGYTILFEGVKPGTPENQAIFNQSIGFSFTPTLYTSFADLMGMTAQDNKILFENIPTTSLVSVDLSLDEIITIMGTGSVVTKKETPTGLSKIFADLIAIFDKQNSPVVDIESTIRSLYHPQRVFFKWIAGGFLNWSLKQSEDISTAIIPLDQSRLFETIIDRRNDRIVEYITSHPNDKIAIVYGALHFNGVYASLQKIDKNWKTIDIKTHTPYSK